MNNYRGALSITSQFYFCGIPFRLDSTPKCSLNCSYCFAMFTGGRRSSLNSIASPQRIYNLFLKSATKNDLELGINGFFLKHKMPVHFGGMSDPFSNRLVSSVSRQLIKILCEFECPTVISTKNVIELCSEDTLSLLKKCKHLIIQISLCSLDNIAAKIEPNAPSIKERINAFKLLAKEGFYTMARIQPLIPNQINQVSSELIPMLGEAGVKHAIIEYLKIPIMNKNSETSQFMKDLDWDIEKYYHESNSIRTGREWVLTPEYKWDHLQSIITSIHKARMTYGAGDYGLNHLGDTDCCCGLDRVEGFTNYFKLNIPYIIKKTNSSSIYLYDQSLFILPENSIRSCLNSHCRVENLYTLYDYIRKKWNRPHTENAPDTFLGVSCSGEKDDAGNFIYVYNKPR